MVASAASSPGNALNVVLLAGGYGTRLGKLGRDQSKGLLRLGETPLVDHLVQVLVELPVPFALFFVTNRRLGEAFRDWAGGIGGDVPTVLDNGTNSPEERLGAVGDLCLALEHCGQGQDVLVMVTNALFYFSLKDFAEEFYERQDADVLLAIQEEANTRALRNRGVVGISSDGQVDIFQDKPKMPAGKETALPIHRLRSRILLRAVHYLESNADPDAPGHLMEWLVERVMVVGWKAPGSRLDVGTLMGYREAVKRFKVSPAKPNREQSSASRKSIGPPKGQVINNARGRERVVILQQTGLDGSE